MVSKNLQHHPEHYLKAKPELLNEEPASQGKSPLKQAQKALDYTYKKRMRFGGGLVP